MNDEFYKLSKEMLRALGNQLHQYQNDPGLTFQRDMITLIYGRFMILNALVQNSSQGKEGFTMADTAYHLGSSLASITHEVYELGQEEVDRELTITLEELNKKLLEEFAEGYKDKVKLLKSEPTDNVTIQ